MATILANRKSAKDGVRQQSEFCHRERAKSVAACKTPYQFLTQRIKPKKNQALEGNKAFQKLTLDREKTISHLNQCATAFAKVRNLDFKPSKKVGLIANIRHVYDFVKQNIPEDRILNIDYAQNESLLILLESERVEFPSNIVFFLPVACLDYMDGALRKLMLYLFNLLIYRQGFCRPSENYYFMYSLDLQDYDDFEEDDVDKEHTNLYYSYREGHVHELMEEIYNYRVHEDICALFNKARSEISENVTRKNDLLTCIEKGIILLQENRVFGFEYSPGQSLVYELDNSYSEERMRLEGICCLSYGATDKDDIAEMSLNFLNDDAGNLEEVDMFDVHEITPHDTSIWAPSDYPHRLSEWFFELFDLINDYAPK